MRTEWTTTRPNGKPIEPGTFCRVLDMEDGTNPIYFYGKTEDDVNEKIALNNLHTRRALERRAEPSSTPQPIAVAQRKRMTADETAQAYADLQNPAKMGPAITKIVENETGVNLKQMAMDGFKARANEWIEEHPEFYNCKPNRSLLATRLGQLVNGDVALITKEMMTQCFGQMIAAGDLVDYPADEAPNATQLPEEMRVQRVEAIPGGRNGTGTRSTSFRASQTATPKTLKYTREQIDRMSLSKAEALIKSGDKDYADACEFYYPSKVTATA